MFENLELPPTADFHVHLRDGTMMELVVPTIRQGGCDTVLVMPNLQPPVDTVEAAIAYHARLKKLAPDVAFLMTLYLNENVTPATIAAAARAGCIVGVKVYPQGVTTHSEGGVQSYEAYYPVFAAMQQHDLVLNLHGELPSSAEKADEPVTVLNAEAKFIPTLQKLHRDFPALRIVLEHCSTRDAVEAVMACGPSVVGTITAHHLWMTVDDWCGDAHSLCKPVAKSIEDRRALVCAATGDSGKFFFGSDSAPHPVEAKTRGKKIAFGCFTQGWTTALVLAAVEEGIRLGWVEGEVSSEVLAGFLGRHGRTFYKISQDSKDGIIVEAKGEKIPDSIKAQDGKVEVVPFRSGEKTLSVSWKM